DFLASRDANTDSVAAGRCKEMRAPGASFRATLLERSVQLRRELLRGRALFGVPLLRGPLADDFPEGLQLLHCLVLAGRVQLGVRASEVEVRDLLPRLGALAAGRLGRRIVRHCTREVAFGFLDPARECPEGEEVLVPFLREGEPLLDD